MFTSVQGLIFRSMMMTVDPLLVVIDLETTGLSPVRILIEWQRPKLRLSDLSFSICIADIWLTI